MAIALKEKEGKEKECERREACECPKSGHTPHRASAGIS